MAKIKKRNDDIFCQVLAKHNLLSKNDISELQNLCPSNETGMDLNLIGVDIETSKRIFRDWKNAGLMRQLMGSVYNYGPNADLQKDIKLFFDYWTKPATKRILLRMIESCKNENRRKAHVGLGRYF